MIGPDAVIWSLKAYFPPDYFTLVRTDPKKGSKLWFIKKN